MLGSTNLLVGLGVRRPGERHAARNVPEQPPSNQDGGQDHEPAQTHAITIGGRNSLASGVAAKEIRVAAVGQQGPACGRRDPLVHRDADAGDRP